MDAVDLDVENLFNDGQLDQIITTDTLPAAALTIPGLSEHFLKLKFAGGFSRISWSRQGHIAVISEDGSNVSIHCLRSSTKTREWKLSTGRPLDATFENAINVTWSPSGYDLAILDRQGHIAIYSMTTLAVNRLNEIKFIPPDISNEAGILIGTWWLNQDRQDRPRSVVTNATRVQDRWTHNMTKAKVLGPLYPRAYCTINRLGALSMIYQRPGARYNRVTVNLPGLSDTVCSHAAFSPTTENKILIAVHSTGGNLSVYLSQINWPPDLMTDPTSTAQPDLVVETVDICVSMWSEVDAGNTSMTQGYRPDEWTLTHLVIVPTSDIETAVHDPPAIWAVYTSANGNVNANDAGYLNNSIIKRWSMYSHVSSLHPRFDDIPTKTETASISENTYVVERLTDILLQQVVTSVELVDGGQMVAITTADGRTEFWNPLTQALVSYEGQLNEVTSLAQSGYALNPTANAIINALSPNACSTLNLTEDQKPVTRYTQYLNTDVSPNLNFQDPNQSASVAALILTFARSCWSNTNGDDVLGCAFANYTAHQYPSVISEMYRTLFRDTEFIHEKAPDSEAERLVSKPIINKVLSFQLALFYSNNVSLTSNDESIRFASLSSIWCFTTINLRYIATTFYIFYRDKNAALQAQRNPSQPSAQPLSTSSLDATCNAIHWILDFFRFMLTTILEIGDRQTNPDFFTTPTFANNLGDAAGDGSQGLVALILNSQWSRSFLIAISRAMRVFIESNEKAHNPVMARVVHTIRRYSIGKGMNISTIDRLLDPQWYVRNGLREGESMDNATIAKRQMSMMSTGRVGPEYAGTLRLLLEKVVNDTDTGLRATGDIERLKLWTDTPDLNWLFLGFNPRAWAETQSANSTAHALNDRGTTGNGKIGRKLYDVHRKSQIIVTGSPDQLIRRCVRCGSVSGDIEGVDKAWSKAMVGILARCVCDAHWVLEKITGEDTRD